MVHCDIHIRENGYLTLTRGRLLMDMVRKYVVVGLYLTHNHHEYLDFAVVINAEIAPLSFAMEI